MSRNPRDYGHRPVTVLTGGRGGLPGRRVSYTQSQASVVSMGT
jgi:hypothetical protein